MSLKQKEADDLCKMFYDAVDENGYDQDPVAMKKAWDKLWSYMIRENNFTDSFGIESLDWQIGNWAGDTVIALLNGQMYEESIRVNEQILKIDWSHDPKNWYDNAKRDIADAYSYMGDIKRCFKLYDDYLKEDPLWGWGWIGYFRVVHEHRPDEFEAVLDDLYQKIVSGTDFTDKMSLYGEMCYEYETLGNVERAKYLRLLEREVEKEKFPELNTGGVGKTKDIKIYPNDPCPCGSGKKYKKCCGRAKEGKTNGV